jgi:hypothetical protein
MPDRISAPWLDFRRFDFVRGWLTGGTDPGDGSVECGDGMLYPMEVTGATVQEKLRKIAEIWYRVDDAEFTQGVAWQMLDDPTTTPTVGLTINAPGSRPTNRAYAVDAVGEIFRGYTTPVEDGLAEVSDYNALFLAAEYDRGDAEMWRDIGDHERGLWIIGDGPGDVLPWWNEKDRLIPPVNAFTIYSTVTPDTTDDNFFLAGLTFYTTYPGGEYSSTLPFVDGYVEFSGRVAVVRENPDDDLLAPTNKFYLGVKLRATADPSGSDLLISTDLSDITGTAYEACKYIIRLSGDLDLECPIWMPEWASAASEGYTIKGGEDFIHKATKWRPYATRLGTPAWSTTTGDSANGGPTA